MTDFDTRLAVGMTGKDKRAYIVLQARAASAVQSALVALIAGDVGPDLQLVHPGTGAVTDLWTLSGALNEYAITADSELVRFHVLPFAKPSIDETFVVAGKTSKVNVLDIVNAKRSLKPFEKALAETVVENIKLVADLS